MALKAFRRVRTERADVKQLQDAVASTFQTIVDKDLLDGILIRDVALLASKTNVIEHKLGRELLGYLVVRKSVDENVWDSQGTNPIPASTLRLLCSGDVTISLWVF